MKINKKALAWVFLILVFANVIFSPVESVKAAINTNYAQNTTSATDTDPREGSSQVLQWIGEIVYTLAQGVESIGGKIIKLFSGSDQFPYADKIIFNTIPILDVNFINPANGSFMKDVNGNETAIGRVIRSTYFTGISLSLGFLGILVGILGIKLAIATTGSKKAVYKEAITKLLTCIILLFGLHYLLSGLFYVNEKMVELASKTMVDVLSSNEDLVVSISKMGDADNKAIVKNFCNQCAKECFLSSIPIIGTLYKGLVNCLHAVGQFLEGCWNAIKSWFGGKKDEQTEISKEQLGKMYPKKDDYIKKIQESDTNINVAAYLLKNKYYRKSYLQWVKGNDTNSFSSGGLAGVARNILISVNDVFGVADTGYKALRTLFTSVSLVVYDGNGTPYTSILRENMAGTSGDKSYEDVNKNQVITYQETDDKGKNPHQVNAKDSDGNDLTLNSQDPDGSQYYGDKIKSTKDFQKYVDDVDKEITRLKNMTKEEREKEKLSEKDIEGQVVALSLDRIYAEAFYKYVYVGPDKYVPKAEDLISEMGTFFKESSWYVDTQKGDWSPSSINVLNSILYATFIFQSLVFFVAYCKRFFYVIILSIIGPFVVVYDFGMSVIKNI